MIARSSPVSLRPRRVAYSPSVRTTSSSPCHPIPLTVSRSMVSYTPNTGRTLSTHHLSVPRSSTTTSCRHPPKSQSQSLSKRLNSYKNKRRNWTQLPSSLIQNAKMTGFLEPLPEGLRASSLEAMYADTEAAFQLARQHLNTEYLETHAYPKKEWWPWRSRFITSWIDQIMHFGEIKRRRASRPLLILQGRSSETLYAASINTLLRSSGRHMAKQRSLLAMAT